jgi:anti-anti-sigma factor
LISHSWGVKILPSAIDVPGRHSPEVRVEDDGIRIEVSSGDAVVVITVAGDLDAVSAQALAAPLDTLEVTGRAVLDMADVDFIDSTGLRVILEKAMSMCEQGGSLRIRRSSAQVRRLLHITNLDGLLERDAAA